MPFHLSFHALLFEDGQLIILKTLLACLFLHRLALAGWKRLEGKRRARILVELREVCILAFNVEVLVVWLLKQHLLALRLAYVLRKVWALLYFCPNFNLLLYLFLCILLGLAPALRLHGFV